MQKGKSKKCNYYRQMNVTEDKLLSAEKGLYVHIYTPNTQA